MNIRWDDIAAQISTAIQADFSISRTTPVSGGDINQSLRIEGIAAEKTALYFIKLNDKSKTDMFAAEQAGLAEIASTHTLRVPNTILHSTSGQHSYLVLEYLDLSGPANMTQLGNQLAAMHKHHASQFGWQRNNTIGITPQPNHQSPDWISFWREQRLGYQLELASLNGNHGKIQSLGKSLMDALPALFEDYRPAPSLLHGDLWGGNHATMVDGTPVIFDPATYYGDREADIAMTELFGGYSKSFYDAYQAAYPLHPGYQKRKTLYNLYHILNHGHMFGGGYYSQAETMMQRLLS